MSFDQFPLTVEAKGEVIANNVPEFRARVLAALSEINRNPSTDEEFGQAVADVESLKNCEGRVAAAKAKALADAEDLNLLFSVLDDTCEEIRKARLDLEKQIAKRREEVKGSIVSAAVDGLLCSPQLRARFRPSIAAAVKNKRSVESMEAAAAGQMDACNTSILLCRKQLDSFADAHGHELILDRDELETMAPDSLSSELRRRFDVKKAMDESKRLKEELAAKASVQPPDPRNPHNLPPPVKIGSIPTGPTPAAEWAQWLETCKSTFAALKTARNSLRDPENARRATVLANGINQAWINMKAASGEGDADGTR
jgi:hypothetical protein